MGIFSLTFSYKRSYKKERTYIEKALNQESVSSIEM